MALYVATLLFTALPILFKFFIFNKKIFINQGIVLNHKVCKTTRCEFLHGMTLLNHGMILLISSVPSNTKPPNVNNMAAPMRIMYTICELL